MGATTKVRNSFNERTSFQEEAIVAEIIIAKSKTEKWLKKASKLAELFKDFDYEAYWKEKHKLDFRDEDLLAVIDLKDVSQLKELALEGKIYVDFENQIIVSTSYEVDD